MSGLLQAQFRFSTLLGRLLTWCAEQGFTVTLGECYRDPRLQDWYIQHGLSWTSNSRHCRRLAVDLNLIRPDGTLAPGKDDYKPLGDFWKNQGDGCVWGGDWQQADCDHFEFYPADLHGAI
jgi:hypothetical protein